MQQMADPNFEFRYLVALVGSDRNVALRWFSQISEAHLSHDYSKLVYRRMSTMLFERGVFLTWSVLLSDPVIPDAVRTALQVFQLEAWTDQHFDQGYAYLEHYRKCRLAYDLAKDLAVKFQTDGYLDPDALLDGVTLKLGERGAVTRKTGYEIGGSNSADEMINLFLNGSATQSFIQTGIDIFDAAVTGIPRGSYWVIGGYTNTGKSHMLIHSAIHAALCGERVVVWSLEMNKDQLWARVWAWVTGINSYRILGHQMTVEEKQHYITYIDYFKEHLRKVNGSIQFERPERSMSIEEILMCSMAHSPTWVGIDQATHVKGTDADDQVKALGRVSTACLQYAGGRNLVVALLAQLNEDNEIKYAKRIIEDANLATFLIERRDVSGPTRTLTHDVDVAKARNHEKFIFSINMDRRTSRIAGVEGSKRDAGEDKQRRRNSVEGSDGGVSNAGKKGGSPQRANQPAYVNFGA